MSGDSRRSIVGEWDEKCQKAFKDLKEMLITAPVLKCPDFTKEFILETDASFKGLGAVLSQKHEGKIHPVCYASRGLRNSERNMSNYSSRKLELLALKWAVCDQFKDYLAGREFIIYTDNSPLSHLETSKLGAVESQWVNNLQQFNFMIKYKPGRDNTVADEVSRLTQEEESETDEEYAAMAVTKDANVGELWPEGELKDAQDEMKCFKGIGQLLERDMAKGEKDEWLKDEDFRKLYRVRDHLRVQGGIIWHKKNVGINLWKIIPVLPPRLQGQLLRACHDQFGHQGRNRTLSLVKSRGYWPGMSTTIAEYVAGCDRCSVAKDETPKSHALMGRLDTSKPWEMLAIDFTVLEKRMGMENVLIVTDIFSRYSFAFPIKTKRQQP